MIVLQIPKYIVPLVSLHLCPCTASAPERCRYLVFCVTVNPKSTPLTLMVYSCMKDVL